nr:unnamed protein product [Spirometra erinaceieuropaei]
MDEVELIMPWEKQTSLLPCPHRKLGQAQTLDTSSPVRKSLSYAGIVNYKQGAPAHTVRFGGRSTLTDATAASSSKTGPIQTTRSFLWSSATSTRPRSLTTPPETLTGLAQRQGPRNKLNPLISRISNKLRIRESPYNDHEGCLLFASHFIRFITQEEAQQIDEELFTQCGFSVDQLMELAGLGCATVIEHAYPLESLKATDGAVLICCGPGNNGGDGLVCARHLKLFGYKPTIYYPRTPQKLLYKNLVTQCEKMGIPFLSYIPSDVKILESSYELIVDALFGFGFRPPLKGDFAEVAHQISTLKLPLICIDVPSGWEMTEKTTSEDLLQPDCLISLTAPKLCARRFNGRYHFLAGRFIPPVLAEKYQLNLPPYPGSCQFVQLHGLS